ncbi:hypothetical protein HPB49_020885 [Dermacentor silvarum]|uniref:Uncharacterized protein n=1 Tax=Dermacentor silvarum TaxID=543639 RepID=A0ACB8CZZ3_DERSI|nr:hypothetical protein HPB49_020885 [Dermacentor silvarum]
MLARVPIVQKKTFQVVFRATFPAPAWRTLSLDNVALRPEPCIHPANCDFVEGLCGYVNSFRRDFRWLIGHGRLENPELQPSVPIPQGTQEKTVGLLSPFFDIGDDQTAIGFQYFRNGPDIAKANLSVSCYSDGKPNSIETQYSAELHEVTEWTELNVPLKQGLNCQLAVWVIKGDGTNGAIAIHSVKVQQKDSTPKSNKDTATHCTFDKGTMCGWSSDGGLMTWTLNDPAKKVPGYPRFDHTQRAYKGRFIFVENKNTSYKSAVLKSPVLDVQSTDGACLSLWHIAQHTFNGSITVYYGDQHLLTTITRTSHRWQHALAEFKVPAGSLQLQIEVSIGRGLIALDDLHIAAGPCPQTDFCSWEMDSPCVVNQDPGNVTPWTRCEGKNVGIPDHTHDSLEGSYLYINTTALNSHHPMSRAFLPRRDPTEATCVTFWWRAHGAASQLNVYRFTKETALRDPLVSLRTHSGGDWWNVRTITVTSGTQWNLVFEVVAPAGEKHQSGVMIDDVEFTDGQCPPYNLCTFENECLPWKLSTKGDWETRFEVQRAESFKKLSKDHSTATSDGFYLLYRSTGVKGNRTSLTLREPSRYACVSLWYFLPSLSDGVSLLLQSESVRAGKEVWKEKQFHLPLKAGGAPIEVISGSNREGFVAIDDVLISETECPGTSNLSIPDFTCNDGKKVPVDRVCDFVPDCKDKADEKKCGHCDFRKDACGWNLDDVPRSPPIGIKGERDGNYLLFYANGTSSSKSSHAMIESPKIRNTNKLCTLKFWFNYAGNGDNINVDLHMTVGGYAVPVWTLRSFEGMPKEGVWNEADVEVGRYATEVSFHFSSKQSTQGRAIFALGAIEYSGCALPKVYLSSSRTAYYWGCYWVQRKGNVFEITEQLGKPMFFLTLTKRSKCTTSQFRCANGVCVERNNRCNYADDCGDNSDEEGCGELL